MLNNNFSGKKLSSFCSHDINYRFTFTFTNWIAELFTKCCNFSYDCVFHFLKFVVVCWYLRKIKPKVRKNKWEKKPQIAKRASMYKFRLVNNINLSIVKSLWRTLCPNNIILIFWEYDRSVMPPCWNKPPNVWTCFNAYVVATNSCKMIVTIFQW